MITKSDIKKIKELRQLKKSGKQISKEIHKNYQDTLIEIRKLENKPEPTKEKKLLSTPIKYITKKQIKRREKILIKKKQEKKIIKKGLKQLKKFIKKEKKIKEKKIKEKEIHKEKRREEIREELKEAEIKGYYTTTFSCTCLVSDRKIIHDFAVREEIKDIVETLHNENYPDHNLKKIEEGTTFFHEYSNKPSIKSNSPTEKQKKFLGYLGYSKEEISIVKSKDEARNLINNR